MNVHTCYAQNEIIEGEWYNSFQFNFRPTDTSTLLHYYFKTELSKDHYYADACQAPAISEEYIVYGTDSSVSTRIFISKKSYAVDRSHSTIDFNNYYPNRIKIEKFSYELLHDTIILNFEDGRIENYPIVHLDKEVMIFMKQYSEVLWVEVFLKANVNDKEFYDRRGKYFVIPLLKEYCQRKGLPPFIVRDANVPK